MADQRREKFRDNKFRRKGRWRWWCRGGNSGEIVEEKDSSLGVLLDADEIGTGEAVKDEKDLKFGDDEKFVYHVCFQKAREDHGIYYAMNEKVEKLDFGRDTNRLDYFRVAAFDVNGDDDLDGIDAKYGGGHKTRQVAVEIFNNSGEMKQKRGGGGGGSRNQRVAIGIFADNGGGGGGEVVLERSNKKTACWCRCWCVRCF